MEYEKETNDETSSNTDSVENEQKHSLIKVLKDLIGDLLVTFPELEEGLDKRLLSIKDDNDDLEDSLDSLKQYFSTVFPERFFDILYENNEIFNEDNDVNVCFLPNIDYRVLWAENISDNTRKTLWKYLQLIMFSLVPDMKDTGSFGDTAKLFEAINEDEFKNKLQETMKNMQEMFESSDDNEMSNIDPEDLPNPETIHEHVSSMMEGKLGTLAREIAEETAKDWNIDVENVSSVKDIFGSLMKNPTKLMNMVKNVGNKLDEKIKSGDIKESEILEEATEMMKKMKEVPGMGNIQQMLSKMGLGGKNINTNAMRAHMAQQLRLSQQKERIRAKIGKRKEKKAEMTPEELAEKTAAANKAMAELLQMEGDDNKLVFRVANNEPERSSKSLKKKKRKRKRKRRVKHNK